MQHFLLCAAFLPPIVVESSEGQRSTPDFIDFTACFYISDNVDTSEDLNFEVFLRGVLLYCKYYTGPGEYMSN